MENSWPLLSYADAKETYETLHMFTQILGKIKLSLLPWINHSWHVALHITPSGLSTSPIPYKNEQFQVDLDFIEHKLKIYTSWRQTREFALQGNSVAQFYDKLFGMLGELDIQVKIWPVPVEVTDPIPFKDDFVHKTYNVLHARAFHKALINVHNVLTIFRSEFKGKASPVNFFWGSFDVAFSRFSGRKAPEHPGGIPNLPDRVAKEAYSHEVNSCGFWTGNDSLPHAAFYAYIYPEPEGYKNGRVEPEGAYYHPDLREFILPYDIVRESTDPDKTLLDFFRTTYNTCAKLAAWDALGLE